MDSRTYDIATDIEVTALVDPNTALAKYHLDKHLKGKEAAKWRAAAIFNTHKDMLSSQVIVVVEREAAPQ